MRRFSRVALSVLLSGGLALAQGVTTPKVLIPLIVTDSHRRLVRDLAPESLIISEHKKQVADVSLLRAMDLPLELGLVLDTSTSEREGGAFEDIVKALKGFLGDVIRGPEDEFFLLRFAATAEATKWLKKDELVNLSFNVKLGAGTALYDAIAMGCRERMGPRDWNKRTTRVLVVVSDGDDNLSHLTRDQAAWEALKSGTVVFTIDTRTLSASPGHPGKGERTLAYLAEVSGGRSFTGFSRGDAPRVFAQTSQVMNSMFYATYIPPDWVKPVHEIDVRSASKGKLEVSYPSKYLWVP